MFVPPVCILHPPDGVERKRKSVVVARPPFLFFFVLLISPFLCSSFWTFKVLIFHFFFFLSFCILIGSLSLSLVFFKKMYRTNQPFTRSVRCFLFDRNSEQRTPLPLVSSFHKKKTRDENNLLCVVIAAVRCCSLVFVKRKKVCWDKGFQNTKKGLFPPQKKKIILPPQHTQKEKQQPTMAQRSQYEKNLKQWIPSDDERRKVDRLADLYVTLTEIEMCERAIIGRRMDPQKCRSRIDVLCEQYERVANATFPKDPAGLQEYWELYCRNLTYARTTIEGRQNAKRQQADADTRKKKNLVDLVSNGTGLRTLLDIEELLNCDLAGYLVDMIDFLNVGIELGSSELEAPRKALEERRKALLVLEAEESVPAAHREAVAAITQDIISLCRT